ncbi:type II toxin-antitoxin system VapC family toxin [Tolypothrix sp. PCC 7910]|uniref:type II toxin-antitoxin system VapC family toxin n=1 Tax=Tolypothrix sp. PCC 7910 TaxID=2099387 RepID=UPI0014278C46|nr:type II toxin-antitoxin system VapC family toxin [Tolypothrix sp. PCC 7910]QIR40059.1 type II toxin-antitoxin system VapC family toxin [Tolypothrix sp. PCC 7910]
MKVLLDTHSFLWFIAGSQKLSTTARNVIEDTNNQRCLSLASLWEIAIKQSIGKLTINIPFDRLISEQVIQNSIEILNINIHHITVVSTLPFYHRDPFDRILIAQAIVEKTPVISADSAFDAYPISRLW